MPTILKLMPVLALVLLAGSCTRGTVSPPLSIPPTTTVAPPVTVSSTPPSSTARFDFDTGLPALPAGQNTPFDQTSGGVTARFSSSADPAAYSVQNRSTTFYTLSQFSGNYLCDNDLFKDSLYIKLSQRLTSITLTFATSDSHGPGNIEVPSNIKLNAYMDSTGTTSVGSATTHGSFSSDLFPQGTLLFNSGSQPFNLVAIELPPQPRGATSFFVDNITVTTFTQ